MLEDFEAPKRTILILELCFFRPFCIPLELFVKEVLIFRHQNKNFALFQHFKHENFMNEVFIFRHQNLNYN